jgi:hypothetical protein
MDSQVQKVILSAALLCVSIFAGIWLTKCGRPISALLFNGHKLIALGFTVYTVYQVVQLGKVINFDPLTFTLLLIAGLCVLSLFITGAFLSFEKVPPSFVLWIHKLAPIALCVLFALGAYFHFKE